MLIQINTDNRLDVSDEENDAFEKQLRSRFERFSGRLTRVEVHLRDIDGDRSGPRGIEAKVEVRPAGGQPVVTTDAGADVAASLSGATRKVLDLLDRKFSKLDEIR